MAQKEAEAAAEILDIEEAENQDDLPLEFRQLLQSLPKEKGWRTHNLYQYQGCWFHAKEIRGIVSAQTQFQAQDTDIIVTSVPRSGTIWLKALVYTIVNRTKLLDNKCPKLDYNPHQLVPFLEYRVYGDDQVPDLSKIPPPRLFATHVPYPLLPESIKTSKSRVVYICRDPFDNFISFWQMQLKLRPKALGSLEIEEAFDMYCKGVLPFGPYFDHMIGYWKQSIGTPEKVLFLKYEEMKEDIVSIIKRLAEFMGFPFDIEEEKRGAIEEISMMCNFGNLKDFGVSVSKDEGSEKVGYLRKVEVGDWVNYLTPDMAQRLSKIIEDKLHGEGLTFHYKF